MSLFRLICPAKSFDDGDGGDDDDDDDIDNHIDNDGDGGDDDDEGAIRVNFKVATSFAGSFLKQSASLRLLGCCMFRRPISKQRHPPQKKTLSPSSHLLPTGQHRHQSCVHTFLLYFRSCEKHFFLLYSLSLGFFSFFDAPFVLVVVVIVLRLCSKAAGGVLSAAVTVQMETNRTREGFRNSRGSFVALGQCGVTYFNAAAEVQGTR